MRRAIKADGSKLATKKTPPMIAARVKRNNTAAIFDEIQRITGLCPGGSATSKEIMALNFAIPREVIGRLPSSYSETATRRRCACASPPAVAF